MKLGKLCVALFAGAVLAGCGGGFEGTYTVTMDSNNGMMTTWLKP